MEMIQGQPKLLEREPEQRKPSFPHHLFEEAKFVDPHREAQLLLPEQAITSALATFEIAQATTGRKRSQSSIFSSIYQYLAGWFATMHLKMGGRRRAKARLTRQGELALEQLRYLSQLCDATAQRSPEEVLVAESAFGEAYYEIMNLSANLQKMAQSEEDHHVRRYSKHMSRVLQADE